MARRYAPIVGIALCLALALGGQALADGLVPDASGVATNQAVGKAASSYLTGIKTYGAAVLWNRIDPLLHGYYGEVSLKDQRYMLTTIAVVEELDPTAVQAYDVGAWILIQNDELERGIEMLERGIEANPAAGLLRMDLAQVLQLYGDGDASLRGAVDLAESALSEDTIWTDTVEQTNAYTTAAVIFEAAGRDDLAATAREMADAVVIDPTDLHHHHE